MLCAWQSRMWQSYVRNVVCVPMGCVTMWCVTALCHMRECCLWRCGVFLVCVYMFVLQFVWQWCAVLATQQVLHCFVQRQDVQRLPHNMPRRHGDACHAQPRTSSPSPATQMVPVTHEQQKVPPATRKQLASHQTKPVHPSKPSVINATPAVTMLCVCVWVCMCDNIECVCVCVAELCVTTMF